jgi:hypothetical protein
MSTTAPRPTPLTPGKLEIGMPVYVKGAGGAWGDPKPVVKIEKKRDGGTTTYTIRRLDGSQRVFTAAARLQALPAELGTLAPPPPAAPAKRARKAAPTRDGVAVQAEPADGMGAPVPPTEAPAKRARKAKATPAPAVELTAARAASAAGRAPRKAKATPAPAPAAAVTEVRAVPTLTVTASYRNSDPAQPLVATVSLTAPTLAEAGYWAARFPTTANLKLRTRLELTGPVGVAERVMLLARYDAQGGSRPVPRSILHLPRIVRHARQLGMTVVMEAKSPSHYTSLAQLDTALAPMTGEVPGWAQAARHTLAES